jgi:hypothetical protein
MPAADLHAMREGGAVMPTVTREDREAAAKWAVLLMAGWQESDRVLALRKWVHDGSGGYAWESGLDALASAFAAHREAAVKADRERTLEILRAEVLRIVRGEK